MNWQHEVDWNRMMAVRVMDKTQYPDMSDDDRSKFQSIFLHHAEIAEYALSSSKDMTSMLSESSTAVANWLWSK